MTTNNFLHVGTKTTRARAVATFREIPLPKRRDLRAQHDGIAYHDANGVLHTMRWPVVEEDGGFMRALPAKATTS